METVFGQARLPMTDVGIVIDSEELCPDVDSEGRVICSCRFSQFPGGGGGGRGSGVG